MELRTVSHVEYDRLFGGLHGGSVLAPADLDPPVGGRSLWIPQGGACRIARPGGEVLAREVVAYWSRHGKGSPLAVCVPGGTCTTALLLHRAVEDLLERRRADKEAPLDIRVVVIPCVGDDEYAMRQMMALDRSAGGTGKREDMPVVLTPKNVDYGSARRRSKGYFAFGTPSPALLATYDEMNEAGLCLDLLYGSPAWSLLLQHWRDRDAEGPIARRQVMYVHSGGLEGVASQLTRYKHKGLIDASRLNPR
jgi:1-aminocyclopropane-1-carboxylate deaminase/D-cysteine desulfhydrase-like pyridoxal-dependent ACC family enzyme